MTIMKLVFYDNLNNYCMFEIKMENVLKDFYLS